MQAPKYNELVSEYKEIYHKINLQSKNTHETKTLIQGFAGFLKKADKQLEGLRSQVEIIVEARSGFTQNFSNFVTIKIMSMPLCYLITKKIFMSNTYLKRKRKIPI